MASDYKRIKAENIREYGEGTRHLAFLGALYTDRTHFIFELLQNAEDAGATEVLFELTDEKLEVRHNGRLFNEEDVRGLCGVGEGTKAEDLTQIGRFGIGFKSVYAYTSTPEVHSGDEHFAIEHYVRPVSKPAIETGDRWSTLFLLVFDSPTVDKATAHVEIAERLRNMNVRTLLFLHNLERVKYEISDEKKGHYTREKIPGNCPWKTILVTGNRQGELEQECWYMFERPVSAPDQSCSRCVEIAFKVIDDGLKIERITDSPLVVYFATEKVTHMGFLMQGPYRTTPARDNVPQNDAWNKKLVKETAILIVNALQALKEKRLLTVSVLELLPIRTEYFPPDSMFTPIEFAVRNALLDRELLPTNGGGYVNGRNAKLTRGADLRRLLTQGQVQALFPLDHDVKFLAETITQDRTPELRSYLLNELDIEEITPDSFARKLSEQFLDKQSDEWFVLFYRFLLGQQALWYDLRRRPIIRLENESLTRPFRPDGSPCAYIGNGANNVKSLPVIKARISDDEIAYQFLQEIGIPELDLVAEVIEGILPKYTKAKIAVTVNEHYQDVATIQRAYSTDSRKRKDQLGDRLRKTPFILSNGVSRGIAMYGKPKDIYIGNDELRTYFSRNDSCAWASSEYSAAAISLFEELGLRRTVKVERKVKDARGHVSIASYHGIHCRGTAGFDPDISVDGLKTALSNPSTKNSVFIWNCIAVPNADCIRGVVESSTRKTYENSERCEKTSEFGQLLTDTRWLPNLDGEMHRPADIALDSLPTDFKRDEYTARQLGMKKDAVAELAEEIGVPPEDIKILRQHPEEFKRWKDNITANEAKPKFPERSSSKPERRKKKLGEQLGDSTKKTFEKRDRNVRTSKPAVDAVTWLRDQYTNDDDIMVCQVCTEEMPFRKRDGEYYFEAVEAFQDVECEREEIHLALCPVCAAMYKEFVKRDVNVMQEFRGALFLSNELEVPVSLGDGTDKSVHFVETHLEDLKTILGTLGGNDQNA